MTGHHDHHSPCPSLSEDTLEDHSHHPEQDMVHPDQEEVQHHHHFYHFHPLLVRTSTPSPASPYSPPPLPFEGFLRLDSPAPSSSVSVNRPHNHPHSFHPYSLPPPPLPSASSSSHLSPSAAAFAAIFANSTPSPTAPSRIISPSRAPPPFRPRHRPLVLRPLSRSHSLLQLPRSHNPHLRVRPMTDPPLQPLPPLLGFTATTSHPTSTTTALRSQSLPVFNTYPFPHSNSPNVESTRDQGFVKLKRARKRKDQALEEFRIAERNLQYAQLREDRLAFEQEMGGKKGSGSTTSMVSTSTSSSSSPSPSCLSLRSGVTFGAQESFEKQMPSPPPPLLPATLLRPSPPPPPPPQPRAQSQPRVAPSERLYSFSRPRPRSEQSQVPFFSKQGGDIKVDSVVADGTLTSSFGAATHGGFVDQRLQDDQDRFLQNPSLRNPLDEGEHLIEDEDDMMMMQESKKTLKVDSWMEKRLTSPRPKPRLDRKQWVGKKEGKQQRDREDEGEDIKIKVEVWEDVQDAMVKDRVVVHSDGEEEEKDKKEEGTKSTTGRRRKGKGRKEHDAHRQDGWGPEFIVKTGVPLGEAILLRHGSSAGGSAGDAPGSILFSSSSSSSLWAESLEEDEAEYHQMQGEDQDEDGMVTTADEEEDELDYADIVGRDRMEEDQDASNEPIIEGGRAAFTPKPTPYDPPMDPLRAFPMRHPQQHPIQPHPRLHTSHRQSYQHPRTRHLSPHPRPYPPPPRRHQMTPQPPRSSPNMSNNVPPHPEGGGAFHGHCDHSHSNGIFSSSASFSVPCWHGMPVQWNAAPPAVYCTHIGTVNHYYAGPPSPSPSHHPHPHSHQRCGRGLGYPPRPRSE